MTEDIGSDRHRKSSSAEIDIVKLRERYTSLAQDVHEIKAIVQNISDRQYEVMRLMSIGEQRFIAAEGSISRVTGSVTALSERMDDAEADKRGPIAIIMATLAALAAGATAWIK